MKKCLLVLMAALALTLHAVAWAGERPVLRVGYTNVPGYISCDADGCFSGPVYNFLELVAIYSGYDFEYTELMPGECLKQLMAGRIDVMAALLSVDAPDHPLELFKTKRAIMYSPVGIVAKPGKTLERGSNMRIGVVPGAYSHESINKALKNYDFEEGVDYTLTDFPEHGQMVVAYEKGEIDGYINAAVYHKGRSGTMIAHLFSRRLSIAMASRNREAAEKIDRAAEEVLLVGPEIRNQIDEADSTISAPLLLTADEREYLRNHPVISAVAYPGEKPYTYFENGEAKGIIAEIAHRMEKDLGIRFEVREAKDSAEVLRLLANGEVEVVNDYFLDFNWGHRNNALLSFPYMTVNYVQVMRRDRELPSAPKVACAKNHFYTHKYVENAYPKEQLVYYDTVKECMDAVNDGKADMTVVKSIIVQHIIEQGDYLNLYTNGNVVFSHKVSFAVSQSADPRLIRILNKEITHIGEGAIEEIATQQSLVLASDKSLKAYIARNPMLAMGILAALALAVIGVLLYIMRMRRRAADKIYSTAYYNHLTGLTNTRWFEKKAPRIIKKRAKDRKDGRLFVLVLSTQRIDLLKASIDQATVSNGIRELIEKARAKNPWMLADGISSGLTHFYVLGCLPEDMTLRGAAEKIAYDTATMTNQGYNIHMDYDFGICAVPEDGPVDIVHLMADADTAQMEAIEKGDHIGIYDKNLQQKRLKQKTIEGLMKKGLANEEFQIWLQPKYDIRTHKVIGAEALTRWQSPELGFMMPGLFIDLFEKNGFIIEFDYYVLEQVCKLQRRRIDEGRPVLPFSVNQSGLHIREPGYLDRLQEIVRRYDLPPGAIDLEITETAFVDFDTQEGRGNSAELIAAMKWLGFTVSMDDFCTGYSSIAMLQHLDMDVMKIDRAMLLASEATDRGRKIMRQVVSLGQNLNMLVLCEGVETKEQEELLLSSGCHFAQGFLFGRPMPAEDFFAFVDGQEAGGTA